MKPAVAEIELHRVSNVKSKGSLTVIKRPSAALSSSRAPLKLYLPRGKPEFPLLFPLLCSVAGNDDKFV